MTKKKEIKISVRLAASEENSQTTFDLSDIFEGTPKKWESLSDSEKRDIIQNAVNDLPEHPYWTVDNWSQK